MSLCASLRISTISPVVGGQASVTSGWVDWAGVKWCIPVPTHPFCFLLSKGRIEEERKRGTDSERRAVCSRFRNNLVLRLEGQQSPQREKKRAFNMGMGMLTSAHWEERTEWRREGEEGGEQLNRWKRDTINTEDSSHTLFRGIVEPAWLKGLFTQMTKQHILMYLFFILT